MNEINEYQSLAIKSFNDTWTLIDKSPRSDADNERMIRLAHTSKHYWVKAKGTALNMVRGDWLISHVYAITNNGEAALQFAQKCLDKTLENEIGDFDKVFAYEAMARAYFVLGNETETRRYLDFGYDYLQYVSEEDDMEYCKSQLDNIK